MFSRLTRENLQVPLFSETVTRTYCRRGLLGEAWQEEIMDCPHPNHYGLPHDLDGPSCCSTNRNGTFRKNDSKKYLIIYSSLPQEHPPINYITFLFTLLIFFAATQGKDARAISPVSTKGLPLDDQILLSMVSMQSWITELLC